MLTYINDGNRGIMMNVENKLIEEGYEDVVFFTDYSYDEALIGVDTDNRAVYDFNKMVRWLIEKEDLTMNKKLSNT